MNWQPIDAAPKDGTWILVINAANPGRQYVACYSTHWGERFPWVTGGGAMDWVDGLTHFMPLPEPPKEQA